jgi:hypothetical protein
MVSRAVFFCICELELFPLGLSSRANATCKSTHKSHNDSFEKALSDNLLDGNTTLRIMEPMCILLYMETMCIYL